MTDFMKAVGAIKWYLIGVALAGFSSATRGAAEGNANKALMMNSRANSDLHSGTISEEEHERVNGEARVFVIRTDELRHRSFWLLIGSVLTLAWSGFRSEPISKFFRDRSIVILVIAMLMQMVIV